LALIGLALVGLAQASAVPIRSEKKEQKPKPITTASGLTYVDLKVGKGVVVARGDTVAVHYTGWLKNGKQFDSSVNRQAPFQFTVGAGTVIKGWDEGIQGMKLGGKRKLTIPPQLGYGERGAGGLIPPKAVLIFEVEVVGVDRH
jgi:FKBP-type peptidyl-prolyl cis-trans isomerase